MSDKEADDLIGTSGAGTKLKRSDNVDSSYRSAAEQLTSIIERLERLAAEKKDIADDMKEVFAEAKANGYHPKALRKMLKERAEDASEREEFEAICDTYRVALGMVAS